MTLPRWPWAASSAAGSAAGTILTSDRSIRKTAPIRRSRKHKYWLRPAPVGSLFNLNLSGLLDPSHPLRG